MRLSPLDIKKQSFSKKLRGIDDDEVQAFLEMAANQWENVLDENRRLEDRVREMENKLEHYEKVEEALQEALQTARDSSEQRLKNAEEQASVIKKDAESEARHIVHDAREERERSRHEAETLANKTQEITTRLRSFLQAELEMLERYDPSTPALPASPSAAASGLRENHQAASAQEAPTADEGAAPAPVERSVEDLAPSNRKAPVSKAQPESDELEKIRRILSDLD